MYANAEIYCIKYAAKVAINSVAADIAWIIDVQFELWGKTQAVLGGEARIIKSQGALNEIWLYVCLTEVLLRNVVLKYSWKTDSVVE